MSSTIALVGLAALVMSFWYAISFIWTGVDLWRNDSYLSTADMMVEDMFRRGGKLVIWLAILFAMLDLTQILMTSTP